MEYRLEQVVTHGQNSQYRDFYIRRWISSLQKSCKIIDVGAGPMPYKDLIKKNGLTYHSHDFEQYSANANDPGLQSEEWPVYGHDYVCDITELNASNYDYAICTEVLEHVPNPAAALANIAKTVKPGGRILITLPFASRMHQAPYWFSSGLSRYWFEFHAPLNSLEIMNITIAGDFVDQMISESEQLLNPLMVRNIRIGRLILRVLKNSESRIRRNLSADLLESGGIGIYVELKRSEFQN